MSRRTIKLVAFCDPEPTDCLVRIASGSTRTYVEAYVHDSIGIYYLDADHAMLAFPIELAKALSKSRSIVINSDERTHLRTLFSDSAGPFRVAQQFFPVV